MENCPYVKNELTKLIMQAEPRSNKYLTLSYKQVDEIISDYLTTYPAPNSQRLDKIELIKKCRALIIAENPYMKDASLLKPIKEFIDYLFDVTPHRSYR